MEEKIVNEQVSLENASPEAIAEKIAEILDAKKGRDIKVLPITDRTDIADYFVIASGTSNTHIRTLADEVEYQMNLAGVSPMSYEGRGNNSWILIDYGCVVVHVFSREAREFYNLDKLYREKSGDKYN
mgnify:FL=1